MTGDRLKTRALGERLLITSALLGPLALAACGVSSGDVPCKDSPFLVYAQNDWPPAGAVLKKGPSLEDEIIAGLMPNQPVSVVGWKSVSTEAYPNNPKGSRGKEWLLVRYEDGLTWVNSGAVRSGVTNYDPLGRDSTLENPVELPPRCEIR